MFRIENTQTATLRRRVSGKRSLSLLSGAQIVVASLRRTAGRPRGTCARFAPAGAPSPGLAPPFALAPCPARQAPLRRRRP